MDLDVLKFLIDNEEQIKETAENNNLDPEVSLVIARILYDNKGDLSSLKGKQNYHYEKVIEPLFFRECEGPVGLMPDDEGNFVSSCVHTKYIDEESLLLSYEEEDFKCQNCRYDTQKW